MFNKLYIIGSIAAKDILDAIKNRFIVYQIIALSIILISIKGLSLVIQPPEIQVVVFDQFGSAFTNLIDNSPDFAVVQVQSLEELQGVISNMGFGLGAEMGLEIPADFDTQLEKQPRPSLQGYVSWVNRNQAARIQAEMETALGQLVGKPILVSLEAGIITPPAEIGMLVGIVTLFAITIILTVGVTLVPSLMIEEKQNRTLEALLVSPASIGQVVAGKALAGAFYILVTTLIVYMIYWAGVYDWAITALFVLGAVLFAVSLGLLFGVSFNRQQEMTGWLSLVMILIAATILLELLNLELPGILENLLAWLPTVALAKIFWASFSSQADFQQVLVSFAVVAAYAGILFGFTIWKINRLDR